MFRPLAMKHVRIQILTGDLPRACLTLAELGIFSPDPRPDMEGEFPRLPGEHYGDLYAQAHSRLERILKLVPLATVLQLQELREVTEADLERLGERLREIWGRCSEIEEQFRQLNEEERGVRQLEHALDNFAHLDLDLGLLQGEKLFLHLAVGSAPRSNIPQLREALTLAGSFLYVFMEGEEYAHIIVAGPRGEREEEVHHLLDTAGFTPFEIPRELNQEPERVRRELQARRETATARRRKLDEELEAYRREIGDELEQARRTLAMAEPFVQVDSAARSSGLLATIRGWVPARELPRLHEALQAQLGNPYLILDRNPEPRERADVPTAMRPGRLTRPFTTLVKEYGIPRYGEIDPTLLFAVSFMFMFGMMFGDIGHGLVIIAAAWFARRTLRSFVPFVVGNGIAATLFGALYGSIFGFEEVLHPLWIAPLSDPIYMLKVALGWGVGFLLLISVANIYNRLITGLAQEALFGPNGVVSVILYLSLLGGFYNLSQDNGFGILPGIAFALSILSLVVYQAHELHAPVGERIIVALVESFEAITGYMSNTLSFLRVAAFSLNHVALAIAVFTLADQMGPTGHWITVVLGNVFILVLEGAIVTIQALRLEYYEGFSRFFSGDGREFKPLRLAGRESAEF
jgi:V/A-type H+/Na+-transporting ATPase subunit I